MLIFSEKSVQHKFTSCSWLSRCTCQEILRRSSSAESSFLLRYKTEGVSVGCRETFAVSGETLQSAWRARWRTSCLLLLQLLSQSDLSSPPLLPLSSPRPPPAAAAAGWILHSVMHVCLPSVLLYLSVCSVEGEVVDCECAVMWYDVCALVLLSLWRPAWVLDLECKGIFR